MVKGCDLGVHDVSIYNSSFVVVRLRNSKYATNAIDNYSLTCHLLKLNFKITNLIHFLQNNMETKIIQRNWSFVLH